MQYASDQASTAQTDTSLVTARGAGFKVVVDTLFFSSAVANTVTVESATTRLWEAYVPANESIAIHVPDGIFEGGANEALTYTTTGAGNTFISIRYKVDMS